MTGEDLRVTIAIYRKYFEDRCVVPMRQETSSITLTLDQQLAHCAALLPEIEQFIADGRLGKAFRWLGFIQGTLFGNHLFCIENLKNHSRPIS